MFEDFLLTVARRIYSIRSRIKESGGVAYSRGASFAEAVDKVAGVAKYVQETESDGSILSEGGSDGVKDIDGDIGSKSE